MTDNLDNEIWKVYQTIPMHSSNPEDHIKPLRELMSEQLKQERNKAIDDFIDKANLQFCQFEQPVTGSLVIHILRQIAQNG